MTLQTMIIILLWFFAIVFLAGLLLIIYLLGRHSIKDNPNQALVFVKTGSSVGKPYKALLYETSKKGCCYRFKYNNRFIFVPTEYEEIYYCNKRMVFISKQGQIVASPFTTDVQLKDEASENLIYELCASHVGADGMRALKGKNTTSVILVAVIALIIGIIGTFGFIQLQAVMAKQQAIQQQPKIQQLPPPVEVK